MKSELIIILTMFFVGNNLTVFAQDLDKNESYYGLIKLSYINNTSVVNIYNVPGQGDQTNIIDPSQSYAVSINYLMGYFIVPRKFTLGGGLGLDGFNNPDMPTFPIYVDARYFFTERKNTFYFYGSLGGLVKLSEVFYRGIYGRIGFGYTFFATRKLKTNLDFSYCPTGVSLSNQSYFSSANKISMHGYGISLGFVLF